MIINIAEHASMQAFFNCYMRETQNYQFVNEKQLAKYPFGMKIIQQAECDQWVLCKLTNQQIYVIAPVTYQSQTGRHLFSFPFYYVKESSQQLLPLDYVTLVTLLTKELTLCYSVTRFPDELIFRVLQSKQFMQTVIDSRQGQLAQLYDENFDFLDMEQSLLFGHLLHPTPKSRQGLSEQDQVKFSPEYQGKFPMHYFVAHRSIVKEDSVFQQTATQLIKEEIMNDEHIDQVAIKKYLDDDQYAIIPIHPVQATYLLQNDKVQKSIDQQLLINIGIQGKDYYPTSSFRTVYHPQSSMMYKCSVNIQITNSRRLNKRKELERGVEIARLLDGSMGEELGHRYPQFQIIRDPAYITVNVDGQEQESGFELVLRENPFVINQGKQVALIAGICQDALPGYQTVLSKMISEIAKKEARSVEEVSLDWFRRYLNISLNPMMWLYFTYGIALEAHQQNSLVKLKNGYPVQFYYRDNQGYYYCESTLPLLKKLLPDINEKSQTVCPDRVVDERFRYYLFFNHLMGLIQSFGANGLIAEEKLLSILREYLLRWAKKNREPSTLIASLLTEKTVTCKGNLLTRLYDMDELVGAVEHQSKYVEITNPMTIGVGGL